MLALTIGAFAIGSATSCSHDALACVESVAAACASLAAAAPSTLRAAALAAAAVVAASKMRRAVSTRNKLASAMPSTAVTALAIGGGGGEAAAVSVAFTALGAAVVTRIAGVASSKQRGVVAAREHASCTAMSCAAGEAALRAASSRSPAATRLAPPRFASHRFLASCSFSRLRACDVERLLWPRSSGRALVIGCRASVQCTRGGGPRGDGEQRRRHREQLVNREVRAARADRGAHRPRGHLPRILSAAN